MSVKQQTDKACDEALFDSAALRRFVGIDPGKERAPVIRAFEASMPA